jgi:hypothetical protein
MTILSLLRLGLGVLIAAAVFFRPDSPVAAQDYEIWAMDQGTNTLHVYNSKLEEVGRIDMGAQGLKVPHMIDFTSDYAYAAVAHPSSGNVAVIRTSVAAGHSCAHRMKWACRERQVHLIQGPRSGRWDRKWGPSHGPSPFRNSGSDVVPSCSVALAWQGSHSVQPQGSSKRLAGALCSS